MRGVDGRPTPPAKGPAQGGFFAQYMHHFSSLLRLLMLSRLVDVACSQSFMTAPAEPLWPINETSG